MGRVVLEADAALLGSSRIVEVGAIFGEKSLEGVVELLVEVGDGGEVQFEEVRGDGESVGL